MPFTALSSRLALLVLALLTCLPVARGQGSEPTQQPVEAPVDAPMEAPRVLAIEIEGAVRYSETQLRLALGQGVGEPIDSRAIDRGIKRLWASFHVRAKTEVQEVPGGLVLRLIVTELPSDREPRFIGNDKIKTKRIKEWALLSSKAELFVHQAERVRQRILEGYRREGFLFAEVNIVTRSGGSLPDVIFDIREGPKVRVKGVKIRGNHTLPDARFLYFFKSGISHLSKRKLRSPSLFSWFGTEYVEETLQADLLAMRQVYRDQGWLDAVVEIERLEFNDKRTGVVIHIVVDEGEQYTVSKLTIEGVEWMNPDSRDPRTVPAELVLSEQRLLRECELKPGTIFQRSLQLKDSVTLRKLFGGKGYLSHPSLPRRANWSLLEPVLTFDVEKHEVEVAYQIVQGRRLWIGEVIFAGSRHTRDRILRREVSVFPGDEANMEEIQRSLARIQGTRYFSDEMNRLEHRDPTYTFLSDPDDPTRVDVEFEVNEGRVVDFNISGGIDSNDGAFGLVSVTMRNFDITDRPSSFWRTFTEVYNKEAFHGAGQLVMLEVAPGTQVSRFRARFREPDLFRSHLNPISLDIDLSKRFRAFTTHDEERGESRVRFGRRFGYDLSAAIGYRHTVLDLDELDDPVPPRLTAQSNLGEHYFQGATVDFSARSLDNFLVPHRGYSLRLLNSGVYGGAFGGEFDFWSARVVGNWYQPAYQKADGTEPVFHLKLDSGVSQPYGDTDDIPFSERFFIGGTRTLRGFKFREVGPFDPVSGEAEGGETMITGSVEFQYPLHSVVQPGTYQRLESLRGTLFFDFGILDEEPFALDSDELRASVGFGIGLAWPIPITLNFGFPVIEDEEDGTQVFSFSLGGT